MIVFVQVILRLLADFVGLVALSVRPRRSIEAENLFLRRELALYKERGAKPRRVDAATRVSLAFLSRLFDWRDALELQAIVPTYAVPIVPIISEGQSPLSMFSSLTKFDWVLPPLVFDTEENLFKGLRKAVIEPAVAKGRRLVHLKDRERTRRIHQFL